MKCTPILAQKKAVFITNYFPSIHYFLLGLFHYEIYLEACENYQKHSLRNRCEICTVNGKIRLTVPLVKGKNRQCPIKDVRIAYHHDWPNHHLKTLQTAYGSAPYFCHYMDEISRLLLRRPKFLFDLNKTILDSMFTLLDLSKIVKETSQYDRELPTKINDFRNLAEVEPFSELQLSKYPYEQVFSDRLSFIPNLSILDLILCKGPETAPFLHQIALKLAI